MRLCYFIKEAFLIFLEEPKTILVSILVIAFSFLVFNFFFLVTWNLKNASDKLNQEIKIEVFLKDDLIPSQVDSLKGSILKLGGVKKITYKSKFQALKEMKRYFGEKLLEGLDFNPLPASFVLELKEPYKKSDQIERLVSKIKQLNGVEDLEYGKVWVSKLERMLSLSFLLDLILGIIIGITSILMVTSAIRLCVTLQKGSLDLIRLLGAKKSFILTPYLLNGMIQGGLGGASSWVLIWGLSLLLTYGFFRIEFLPGVSIIILILSGFLIGGIGSLLALRRFLT